jgi:predicted metal-dependent hydrolase
MVKEQKIHKINDLEFRVIYSRRRSIGISVHPDSSVIVRVPYLTSLKTISRVVNEKYSWVLKHRDNYRKLGTSPVKKSYTTGETHLFRGDQFVLKVENSGKSFVRAYDHSIQVGTEKTDDAETVRKLLYKWYKSEAMKHFPEVMNRVLIQQEIHGFRPTGLVIRTMKRRWGSCSGKGKITLSTELIKLSDLFIEYVIIHELCHLKHHNHGPHFYKLLAEVFPEWKTVRKELRKYIQ